MPDDRDPKPDNFTMRFARWRGYDRRGKYYAIAAIAYLAACVGIMWLIVWVARQFGHS